MISTTSGPPEGGMIGNALDKGAGYGPYFDHFGFACGMEIVLGNGEIIRTGDGSIDLGKDELVNWHVSKYAFGPILDGLFAQSNFGIVTYGHLDAASAAGDPLVPLRLPRRRRLGEIVELCRPLKLSNFVPTCSASPTTCI